MATLGELVVSLSANTAQFTSAMDKAAFTAQKRMDQMLASANQLGMALGTTLATGALAVAAAMKVTVDRLDALGENAQKIGVTTEALSGLEFVAEMSGVAVETLHGSMGRLNKAIAEGNPAFDAMGISVKDANGELKSADVVLKEVASKFAGYRDGAEKSALAMELMGKSGAEMVPMLNQGAGGFSRLVAEAKSMGLVVGEAAEIAGRLNDNIDRMIKTQGGLVTQLTVALLPVIERASEEFVTLAKNTDLVSTPAAILKTLFQTLAVVGSDVAFVFKMTGAEIGGIAAQLAALGRGDFAGFSAIGEMMKADAAAARSELDAFQDRIMGIGEVAAAEAKKVEQGGGLAAPIVKAAERAKKAKKELDDLLLPAAREYARAIEKINSAQASAESSAVDLDGAQQALKDLMADPLWQQMPEPWQKTAIAQAQSASAMIEIADRQKRLNDMLAATPTAKLVESRAAMQLLKEEFEAGRISGEEFAEAAGTYLGTLPQYAEKAASNIDIVIGNAFDGAANAVADFAMGSKTSFGDMVMSMIRDLIKLQAQMAMTEAFKSAGGSSGIMGSLTSLVGGFFGGGSSSTGLPSLPSSVNATFAKGGVFENSPSLSAYSGRVYDSPQPFLFAKGAGVFGEAGPEAIMPLKRGADGKLGVSADGAGASVTVNVINNTGAQTRQTERQDGRGGKIIDVLIEQVEARLAGNISTGNGPVPAALQASYGINRTAGAY